MPYVNPFLNYQFDDLIMDNYERLDPRTLDNLESFINISICDRKLSFQKYKMLEWKVIYEYRFDSFDTKTLNHIYYIKLNLLSEGIEFKTNLYQHNWNLTLYSYKNNKCKILNEMPITFEQISLINSEENCAYIVFNKILVALTMIANGTFHSNENHDSSEHNSSEHDSSEHDSSEHDSSEHDSSEHDSSEHDSSEHNSSEDDASSEETIGNYIIAEEKTDKDILEYKDYDEIRSDIDLILQSLQIPYLPTT
jgi:hypothetical protein